MAEPPSNPVSRTFCSPRAERFKSSTSEPDRDARCRVCPDHHYPQRDTLPFTTVVGFCVFSNVGGVQIDAL